MFSINHTDLHIPVNLSTLLYETDWTETAVIPPANWKRGIKSGPLQSTTQGLATPVLWIIDGGKERVKTSVPQSAWVALRSSHSRKKKLVTEKRSIWLYTDTTENGCTYSSILGIVGQDGGSHHYLHSHGILSFPASYMEDVMVSDLNHHRTTETRGLFLYVQDKSLAELLSLHDSVLWYLSITRHISIN